MGRLRLYLITALAFLLEVLVLLWFPVAGVRPRVLPPLVCLVGVEQGPDRGAECGFFGGILCYLAGATPWQMALLALAWGCYTPLAAKASGWLVQVTEPLFRLLAKLPLIGRLGVVRDSA